MINQNEYNQDGATSSTEIRQEPNLIPSLTQLQKEESEHIDFTNNGTSAVISKNKNFYELLPMSLWLACKQPHVIYYVVQSIFQYFKGCEPQHYGDVISTSVLLFLVILCIFFEVHARYRTFYNFTVKCQEKENQVQYQTWNIEKRLWELTEVGKLKEGQILIVEKYLETNPKFNPTTLLPIALASKNRSFLIKTTRIDKKEQYKKIRILKPFLSLIKVDESFPPFLTAEKELYNMRIDYRFISSLGETCEAEISFEDSANNRSSFLLSNDDLIPSGIGISTQDYVIGIVMKQMRGNQQKNLQKALLKQNSISSVLSGYLRVTLLLNVVLLIIVFITNLIVSELTSDLGSGIGQYTYCLILSFVPLFMNTVYISMHILIYIHRIIGQISHKKLLTLNNQNKSIDELAKTDTLIMDDFFSIERPFNTDDFKFAFNKDAPLTDNVDLILKVIEGATILQQHMAGHTIPIAKYFRLNRDKAPCQNQAKVKIMKEVFISEHCVDVKIKIIRHQSEAIYMVRFNDHPVKSTFTKLQEGKFKDEIQQIQLDYQVNDSLMLFIEIMRIDTDLAISNHYYILYGIITFIEDFDKRAVSMLKDQKILNRFNIVMMTNKTRRYMEYFLQKSGMKSQYKDSVIALDEKDQGQINQMIKDHRKSLRKKSRQSRQFQKHCVLFLSSTMITYLSRRNIRNSLLKLAPYCKYIVFYNCSQFEKQICAVNLFKIFQNHLYLSNYLCDYPIFQWADLSISEAGSSSQRLTTFVISKYDQLTGLILIEAVKSLQIIQCITSSHIFKNMFFLGANLIAFFLVFQGNTALLADAYLGQVLFFYNFIFTIGPHIYNFIARPDLFIQSDLCKYVDHNEMISLNIKALTFGIVSGFLAFSMVETEFVTNLFTMVLVMSVVSGNIFVLLVDHSRSKSGMVICIIIQIIFSLLFIVAVQIFDTKNFKFVIIGTNFDTSNDWFYIGTFLVMPAFNILVLYSFSVGRQIWLILNHREMLLEDCMEDPGNFDMVSENNSQTVVKIFKGAGRLISFQEQVALTSTC